ncbi:MAG TPA: phosphatidylserine decarboxylase [Opitutaceae bacterium]|nr:phosphatidylserine decarboxylase [Opitutaceae bacterium]
MSQDTVEFFHRKRRAMVEEKIPGEFWLRWLYSSSLSGRLALHGLVKRAFFSWLYGRKMDKPRSVHRVLPFIVEHDLDVDEFAKQAMAYKTFNEFFARKLKASARPIDPDPASAILPADGRHLVFPDVDAADGFYVKGDRFELGELIGGELVAKQFIGGAMLISRLAPVDYHRFHFPCAGTPGRASEIKGPLFSVNPIALRRSVRYLVQNKRMVTLHETERFGLVALIEVGATMVGGIRQSFIPGTKVKKGDEKGLFKFGGSCVITLFQRDRIVFDADLREQSLNHIETYAKMGERFGVATR